MRTRMVRDHNGAELSRLSMDGTCEVIRRGFGASVRAIDEHVRHASDRASDGGSDE